MIVAAAGHVDHGKTSLVKALTDVDTDRLEEEKRRGMSIDIGFAYADFGLASPVGFVDVPGHERFIRNMLAGVACVDLALLVVAADDGPMPQTLEHLGILQLLGVPRCVVALTKIDRVSAARVAAAEREIAALLHDGPFQGAPVFRLAATTGAGVPALRQHLAELAQSWAARAPTGHFRMAVDRSFTLTGAGRVVTGAVLSGTVRVGDLVTVSPRGTPARVRALHAQDRPAAEAVAGQRASLNLAGSDLKDAAPVRGDWVVAAPVHAPTDRLDVQLDVLGGPIPALLPAALQRTVLQLHIGAAALNARLVVLDAPVPTRGPVVAQLVLDRPIAALHGDRFILREPAANRTVAGGRVIDPFAPARGRATPARRSALAALARPDAPAALAALLDGEPHGIDLDRFLLARNLTGLDTASLQGLHAVACDGKRIALSPAHWRALRDGVCAALGRSHLAQPDSVGCTASELAQALGLRRAPHLLQAALAAAVHDGSVAREGLRHRLPDHRATLSDVDSALLARTSALLQPAGLRPPIVGELAAALALPQPELLDFLLRAHRLGVLVRVAPNRFYLPETVAGLIVHAQALSAESASGFVAAAYRDRTGIGRNLTVQVLEFLDREGVTRFDGIGRLADR
ncbi:selenocysteine-specific translation elongation factor [Variovorax sp. PAMC 28711]|uniref:selenocysteine-specific translation elongation factor n=1 Tax=Variovorax sp. PAMC 28711 TaxID=1795631 RepID=UPI00078D3CCC|nr:selenocysteine-specific translation elongation factor [Variovorax sp. PAMC 28711]AMM24648.1 hypothetical protein AX767_10025 [Variovorax sp. PAMC 28711]